MPRRNNKFQQYQPHSRKCGGKIHYPQRHEAEMAADEIMVMEPELQLKVYKCLDCGGWHLTRAKTLEDRPLAE